MTIPASFTINDSIFKLRERSQLRIILFAIILLTFLDIFVDLAQGVDIIHISVEAIIIPLACAGLFTVWGRFNKIDAENLSLKKNLSRVEASAKQWKQEAQKYLSGLSNTIDLQLERWNLSGAEKEVTLLLLKGLSHKEIAEIRKTSERTTRQQAQALYEKSGLSGRADLAAFFLEDLLAPPVEQKE